MRFRGKIRWEDVFVFVYFQIVPVLPTSRAHSWHFFIFLLLCFEVHHIWYILCIPGMWHLVCHYTVRLRIYWCVTGTWFTYINTFPLVAVRCLETRNRRWNGQVYTDELRLVRSGGLAAGRDDGGGGQHPHREGGRGRWWVGTGGQGGGDLGADL